ncbi:AarF/UbiB family protein [Nocardia vinacea]|uniref:AarF/UbiB family protein n=1 Tax=Nocardia vinacea TaxID=96468 RepID=UPI00343ED9E9
MGVPDRISTNRVVRAHQLGRAMAGQVLRGGGARLTTLCDHAPQTSFDEMRAVLDAGLGPLNREFRDFDEEPLAAASIGQVHRVRLHVGRDVGGKVQYPVIEAAVRADLANLWLFAKFWRSVVLGSVTVGMRCD